MLRKEDLMKRTGFLWMAVVSALTVGCSNADRTTTTGQTPNSAPAVGTSGKDVSSGDKDFIHDVAIANMAEIDLGRMASDRAANPDVKSFGKMMVDDHTAAGDRLKNAV